MKKDILVFKLFLLLSISSVAQEPVWTKQTQVSNAIAFEKSLDSNVKFLSKNVTLSKSYYPFVDQYEIGNPVIAERNSNAPLPVYAEYFFSNSDSILRLISYDWERARYSNYFDKQKIWEEESKKLKMYDTEYERLKKYLLAVFGNPSEQDNSPVEVNSGKTSYLSRKTTWDSKDIYASLTMIFASTTYRIRLTLYWK